MERGTIWKPNNVDASPACPRCGSSNTKFCYYNNYSLTQPRYFCKGCRRYWTKGGSLRNVPVGGGCRKSRRASKSIRVSTSTDAAVNFRNSPHNRLESSTSISAQASSSSTSIDLAAVYANFLNQAPAPTHENNQMEGILNPSPMEFSNFQENGFLLFGPGGGESVYSGGLDGLQEQQFTTAGNSSYNFVTGMNMNMMDNNDVLPNLPPLPGEEVVAVSDHQGMLWPNSDVVMPNHEMLQYSNQEIIGGEVPPTEQYSNLEAIFRS